MQAHAPRWIKLAIQGVPDHRVREVETLGIGTRPQQLRAERLIDRAQRGLFIQARRRRCHLE